MSSRFSIDPTNRCAPVCSPIARSPPRYPIVGRAQLPSFTGATAREAGWIWDMRFADAHGMGVYTPARISTTRAAKNFSCLAWC
ncbi:hypothetical protein EAH76_23405 [Sphingomonas glacialis]|uniref:Uncharacterized protein n=1 Tax=Sphingomonas glacialis TaxID=658225 RepID=A0A502FB86_9SPHN|nr:hypothetical protein EAH76_23405 [Sphingomonas glacialis]